MSSTSPLGSAVRALVAIDYRRTFLALALGGVGGALFAWAGLPLAWMIGAMLFTSASAIAGLPVEVPKGLRSFMVMVLGIMLGSAFDPTILNQAGQWVATLSGLVFYIAICAGLGFLFLRRTAGYDPVTSYFTAMPGGLNEMVLIGSTLGGDERSIALSHSARIMLVVFTVPVWFQFIGGVDGGTRGPLGPALGALGLSDYLLLALSAVGAPVAKWLRMPAGVLVGPMVLSAVIHLSGLTDGRPPGVLVAAAQVVVGAFIGCRFRGIGLKELARIVLVAAGLTALLLGITVGFALGLHTLTGIGIPDLILAYAPGGLAEMSLVALALDVDAAFVSLHHIARIVIIVTFAPGAFLLARRLATRS
ncbi:MAG TPA: AbrB family transcriptional regulator [Alphaproteobacteria bacterium]|nr:AbrB family transcriptional regulator [Alphaproteobacteria bacterium]